MTSGQSAAANERSGEPVNYSPGLIEPPPTYYEVLEPADGARSADGPVSNGGHTDTCYFAAMMRSRSCRCRS